MWRHLGGIVLVALEHFLMHPSYMGRWQARF
jgi:hypothetical protein